MAVILKIFAFITSLLFCLGGTQESVVGYTDGEVLIPDRQEYCYDNDRLLIGAYYGDIDHVEEAAEAKIDFFIDSGITKEYLDKLDEYGIGMIATGYNLPAGYGFFDDGIRDSYLNYDYSTYKDHPALWGDNIIDEPSAESFDNIAVAVDKYLDNTDGKIPYINLFPNYASDEQLGVNPEIGTLQKLFLFATNGGYESASFKTHVSEYINKINTDYISVDYYPYSSNLKNGKEVKSTADGWFRCLDILAEACRDTDRDLWVITQAAGETEKGTEKGDKRYCDEVSDISQQVYASLAFGAKAVIHAEFAAKGWWDPETSHMIDKDGNTTATYDAVKTVDTYISKFADVYGDYTYTSTYLINPLRVAGHDGTDLAVTVPEEAVDFTSVYGLAVGTFRAEGKRAFIVANMEELNNETTASFSYLVPVGSYMTVYKQGRASTYTQGDLVTIELEPGEGVFITMPDNGGCTIC